jgi:hypothetical protein
MSGIATIIWCAVPATSRQRLIMASVHRSPHHWSASLAIIAASMLVTAGASDHEARGKNGSVVLPSSTGPVCATPSAGGPVLDNGLSALRPTRSPRFNAENCDDRSDGDDDTDVPEKDWSRDVGQFGHDLIPVDHDSRPRLIDTLSIPSSSFQQLRC